MKKDLQYYLNLPYGIMIFPDETSGYTAFIFELSGCMTQGETLSETLDNLQEAKELYLKSLLKDGTEIPEPKESDFDELLELKNRLFR